ncbi:MAG: hypothetical protein U9N52_11290, partial [Campylobacterota bacterium]|nr:hypothetical protein [Campylobacterota bacterium]
LNYHYFKTDSNRHYRISKNGSDYSIWYYLGSSEWMPIHNAPQTDGHDEACVTFNNVSKTNTQVSIDPIVYTSSSSSSSVAISSASVSSISSQSSSSTQSFTCNSGEVDLTGSWRFTGGYSNCAGATDEEITFDYQNNHYETTWVGIEEDHDCSTSYQNYDAAAAPSSRCLSKAAFLTMLESSVNRPYFSVSTFSENKIVWRFDDSYDGSIENYTMNKID